MKRVSDDFVLRILWDSWEAKHFSNPFKFVVQDEHGQRLRHAAEETYGVYLTNLEGLAKAYETFLHIRQAAGLQVTAGQELADAFMPWSEAFERWSQIGAPLPVIQSQIWNMWLELASEHQPLQDHVLAKAYMLISAWVLGQSEEDVLEHEHKLSELDNARVKDGE